MIMYGNCLENIQDLKLNDWNVQNSDMSENEKGKRLVIEVICSSHLRASVCQYLSYSHIYLIWCSSIPFNYNLSRFLDALKISYTRRLLLLRLSK